MSWTYLGCDRVSGFSATDELSDLVLLVGAVGWHGGVGNIEPTAWAVEKGRRSSGREMGGGGGYISAMPVPSCWRENKIFYWGEYTSAMESARFPLDLMALC